MREVLCYYVGRLERVHIYYFPKTCITENAQIEHMYPLSIQPVVIVRGLKRQQAAALTNFVGCFIFALSFPFSLLLLSVLNDLTGPSPGPLARTPYSIFLSISFRRPYTS